MIRKPGTGATGPGGFQTRVGTTLAGAGGSEGRGEIGNVTGMGVLSEDTSTEAPETTVKVTETNV